MDYNLEQAFKSLGEELLNSPYLAVMIVDQKLTILWHNETFARDLGLESSAVGKKCFQATSSDAEHANCPTQITLREGKTTRGFYDFGDKNFLVFTIPLPNGLAAKVHTFLPKTANNEVESI